MARVVECPDRSGGQLATALVVPLRSTFRRRIWTIAAEMLRASLTLACALAGGLSVAHGRPAREKPNIVMLFVDGASRCGFARVPVAVS